MTLPPLSSPSLRRRLVTLLVGAVAALWVVVGVATYVDARRGIGALLDAHLAQTASLLAAQAGHELVEIGVEGLGDLEPYGQVVAFQVWSGTGRLMLASRNAPAEPFTRAPAGFSDVTAAGHRWRVFMRRTSDQLLEIQVAEDRRGRAQLELRFLVGALAPLALGLPLLGVLVWIAIGRALQPLSGLRAQVSRRGTADLTPLGVDPVPVEVRPLVEQMNALFERLRRTLDAERRFTAQAAHELRTPVAAIRAQAEAARDADAPADAARALGFVIGSCDRLSRLVGQLLVLGRLDEATERPLASCDLSLLATHVIADLAPAALQRGIEIELVHRGSVSVAGDALLLEVLLRNLIDNAVRHGRDGGQVTVAITADPDGATLRVTDDGPGVPAADLAELGHPFYRVPGTRSSGTGLGLSIVKRIAEEHGATVNYGPGPGGRGLSVSIALFHQRV